MQIINHPSRAFKGLMRPLVMSDLNELWQLDLRIFWDGETYERETFRFLLNNPLAITRQIRSEEDEMAAFGIAVIESTGPIGQAHLTAIGVAPEFRRRGLGLLIMHEMERSLIARGISSIKLEVRATNVAALQLYEKLGYIVTQRMGKYYSNGDDGYSMVKSLRVSD
ncbi:MAG: GNAT family N-acetyltransferase [Blastocatellia bacterium]